MAISGDSSRDFASSKFSLRTKVMYSGAKCIGKSISAFGVRRSAFGVRRSAFGVRRSAFGVLRSAFVGRRWAFVVRRSRFWLVPGSRFSFRVQGSRSGFKVLVLGSRFSFRVRGSRSGFAGSRSTFRGFRFPGSSSCGTVHAHQRCMPPIERIEDLIAWQLARTLEQQVLAFTANPPASKDGDFCYQIRKSASSAPTNMAEGFGRFWPAEFAYKMRVAIGELEETLRHLDKALDVKYLTEVQHLDLYALGDRAASAAVKFARYLEAAGPD